ncbi:MAG: response regulator, partial [Dehalococcoidia bacterium]
DLGLPDMRGERVLEALKTDPNCSMVPVVVISVDDDTGLSRRLGADDHLTKPLDHLRLQSWLQQVRARERSGETAAS